MKYLKNTLIKYNTFQHIMPDFIIKTQSSLFFTSWFSGFSESNAFYVSICNLNFIPWSSNFFLLYTNLISSNLIFFQFNKFNFWALQGPIFNLNTSSKILTYTKLNWKVSCPYSLISHKNPFFLHFIKKSLGFGRVFHTFLIFSFLIRPFFLFFSSLYFKKHLLFNKFFVYPKHHISYYIIWNRLNILYLLHIYNGNLITKKSNKIFAKWIKTYNNYYSTNLIWKPFISFLYRNFFSFLLSNLLHTQFYFIKNSFFISKRLQQNTFSFFFINRFLFFKQFICYFTLSYNIKILTKPFFFNLNLLCINTFSIIVWSSIIFKQPVNRFLINSFFCLKPLFPLTYRFFYLHNFLSYSIIFKDTPFILWGYISKAVYFLFFPFWPILFSSIFFIHIFTYNHLFINYPWKTVIANIFFFYKYTFLLNVYPFWAPFYPWFYGYSYFLLYFFFNYFQFIFFYNKNIIKFTKSKKKTPIFFDCVDFMDHIEKTEKNLYWKCNKNSILQNKPITNIYLFQRFFICIHNEILFLTKIFFFFSFQLNSFFYKFCQHSLFTFYIPLSFYFIFKMIFIIPFMSTQFQILSNLPQNLSLHTWEFSIRSHVIFLNTLFFFDYVDYVNNLLLCHYFSRQHTLAIWGLCFLLPYFIKQQTTWSLIFIYNHFFNLKRFNVFLKSYTLLYTLHTFTTQNYLLQANSYFFFNTFFFSTFWIYSIPFFTQSLRPQIQSSKSMSFRSWVGLKRKLPKYSQI